MRIVGGAGEGAGGRPGERRGDRAARGPGPTCARAAGLGAVLLLVAGCDAPSTSVLLENRYPAGAQVPQVVFRATWQAVSFLDPVPPGTSSDPQPTVAASDNTAYVLLAPGWDPAAHVPPASLVVLRSLGGFAVHLNETLHIPVDDANFAGRCDAGSFLSQEDADFVTRLVFPDAFADLHYDAATCTTTPAGDAASP